MLCNLVVKGNESEVKRLLDLFENEYGYDIWEEPEQDGDVVTAWIPCDMEKEKAAKILTNVKWMGFVEDYRAGALMVAISNLGSDKIDAIEFVCPCDLHGDDRIASEYSPDFDFEAEMFWESTGDREIISYTCPFTHWWNRE